MKRITIIAVCALAIGMARAESFETASSAVANMKIGWNVGNSLDSNSGDTDNMWIEQWTNCTPADYETAWGQPQTTQALIHMFKEAGFNAIRVPVTWYPHIDEDAVINEDWLERVTEVVDYVIDEGMYCIINVHHDTGSSNTHWLIADGDTYAEVKDKYEKLWTNIATAFIEYDEHLLFEAYNEMLDSYNSWCFASFATDNSYDSSVASDAYTAINNYAQSFVSAVRATGGNNAERNLIVNTYAACSGEGTWNSHLSDPLTQLTIPTDDATDHIAAEVHVYPTITSGLSTAVSSVTQCFGSIKTNLVSKGVPVIIGEWGTSGLDSDYTNYQSDVVSFAEQFVALAKEYGYATFMWMMLSDGDDRSVPQWSCEDLKDAVVKGYYGEEGYVSAVSSVTVDKEDDGAYYDVAGRRVASPEKGIFFRNGQKYLFR